MPDAAKTSQRKSIPKGQLLFNGQWINAEAGETMDVIDSTTEASITTVQKGSAVDTKKAMDAASAAFEDGPRGRMRHEDRAKTLIKMADLMDERAEDFAIREAMDACDRAEGDSAMSAAPVQPPLNAYTSTRRAVDAALKCFGRIDVVVSNAGIGVIGPVEAGAEAYGGTAS